MKDTTELTLEGFKREAKNLRKNNPEIKSHAKALDQLAKEYGHQSWKTLKPIIVKQEEENTQRLKEKAEEDVAYLYETGLSNLLEVMGGFKDMGIDKEFEDIFPLFVMDEETMDVANKEGLSFDTLASTGRITSSPSFLGKDHFIQSIMLAREYDAVIKDDINCVEVGYFIKKDDKELLQVWNDMLETKITITLPEVDYSVTFPIITHYVMQEDKDEPEYWYAKIQFSPAYSVLLTLAEGLIGAR